MQTRTSPRIALILAVFAPLAVQAAPINYDVVYQGANPGVGSFSWDADTDTFASFVWDFGPGLNGGLRDSINWSTPVFGGTRGGIFFEVLTGEDQHPTACGTGATCSTSFVANELLEFPSLVSTFSRSIDTNSANYFFLGTGGAIRSGTLTATRSAVSVPEPSTLALVLLGLAAFALRRGTFTTAPVGQTN